MKILLDHTPAEVRDWFAGHGLPTFRAGQVRKWIFQQRVAGFDEMTDLPAALRKQLADEWQIWTTKTVANRRAADGSEKLLLELADSQRIECVLLRDDRGHHAACISSQVGCAMGCAFCATGLEGFVRNLTRGEIVEQLLHLQRLLPADRLSHVVVMGMGEPLLNLDAVLSALEEAAARDGLGISVRRITISTVGIPEGIRRLAREKCPYHLAVSLHAADDELRNKIVPANRGFGIAAILAAADEFFERTGRRVTYEYVLLSGINDRPEDARRLVRLLRGRPALVNLIPYNPVPELPYRRPSPGVTARFAAALTDGGLNANIRHRKGDRISAACGQLRRGGEIRID
jgi:23S rRNA (adenine2503-C2)-methyltransferase